MHHQLTEGTRSVVLAEEGVDGGGALAPARGVHEADARVARVGFDRGRAGVARCELQLIAVVAVVAVVVEKGEQKEAGVEARPDALAAAAAAPRAQNLPRRRAARAQPAGRRDEEMERRCKEWDGEGESMGWG